MGDLGINRFEIFKKLVQANTENSGKVTEQKGDSTKSKAESKPQENDESVVLDENQNLTFEEEDSSATLNAKASGTSSSRIKKILKKTTTKAETTQTTETETASRSASAEKAASTNEVGAVRAKGKPTAPPQIEELEELVGELEAANEFFQTQYSHSLGEYNKALVEYEKYKSGQAFDKKVIQDAQSLIDKDDTNCNNGQSSLGIQGLGVAKYVPVEGDSIETQKTKAQAAANGPEANYAQGYMTKIQNLYNQLIASGTASEAEIAYANELVEQAGKYGAYGSSDRTGFIGTILTNADEVRNMRLESLAWVTETQDITDPDVYLKEIKDLADQIHGDYNTSKNVLFEQAKNAKTEAEREAAKAAVQDFIDDDEPKYVDLLENPEGPWKKLEDLYNKIPDGPQKDKVGQAIQEAHGYVDPDGTIDNPPNIDANIDGMKGVIDDINNLPPISNPGVDEDINNFNLELEKYYNSIETAYGSVRSVKTAVAQGKMTVSAANTQINSAYDTASSALSSASDRLNGFVAEMQQKYDNLSQADMDKINDAVAAWNARADKLKNPVVAIDAKDYGFDVPTTAKADMDTAVALISKIKEIINELDELVGPALASAREARDYVENPDLKNSEDALASAKSHQTDLSALKADLEIVKASKKDAVDERQDKIAGKALSDLDGLLSNQKYADFKGAIQLARNEVNEIKNGAGTVSIDGELKDAMPPMIARMTEIEGIIQKYIDDIGDDLDKKILGALTDARDARNKVEDPDLANARNAKAAADADKTNPDVFKTSYETVKASIKDAENTQVPKAQGALDTLEELEAEYPANVYPEENAKIKAAEKEVKDILEANKVDIEGVEKDGMTPMIAEMKAIQLELEKNFPDIIDASTQKAENARDHVENTELKNAQNAADEAKTKDNVDELEALVQQIENAIAQAKDPQQVLAQENLVELDDLGNKYPAADYPQFQEAINGAKTEVDKIANQPGNVEIKGVSEETIPEMINKMEALKAEVVDKILDITTGDARKERNDVEYVDLTKANNALESANSHKSDTEALKADVKNVEDAIAAAKERQEDARDIKAEIDELAAKYPEFSDKIAPDEVNKIANEPGKVNIDGVDKDTIPEMISKMEGIKATIEAMLDTDFDNDLAKFNADLQKQYDKIDNDFTSAKAIADSAQAGTLPDEQLKTAPKDIETKKNDAQEALDDVNDKIANFKDEMLDKYGDTLSPEELQSLDDAIKAWNEKGQGVEGAKIKPVITDAIKDQLELDKPQNAQNDMQIAVDAMDKLKAIATSAIVDKLIGELDLGPQYDDIQKDFNDVENLLQEVEDGTKTPSQALSEIPEKKTDAETKLADAQNTLDAFPATVAQAVTDAGGTLSPEDTQKINDAVADWNEKKPGEPGSKIKNPPIITEEKAQTYGVTNPDTATVDMDSAVKAIDKIAGIIQDKGIDNDWNAAKELDEAAVNVEDKAKTYDEYTDFTGNVNAVQTVTGEIKTLDGILSGITGAADKVKATADDMKIKYDNYQNAATNAQLAYNDVKAAKMDNVNVVEGTKTVTTPIDLTKLNNTAADLVPKANAFEAVQNAANKTFDKLKFEHDKLLTAMNDINSIGSLTKTEQVKETVTVTKSASLSEIQKLCEAVGTIQINQWSKLNGYGIAELLIDPSVSKTYKLDLNAKTLSVSGTSNNGSVKLTDAQVTAIKNLQETLNSSGLAQKIRNERTAIKNQFNSYLNSTEYKNAAKKANSFLKNNVESGIWSSSGSSQQTQYHAGMTDSIDRVTTLYDYIRSGGNLQVSAGVNSWGGEKVGTSRISTLPNNATYTTTETKTVTKEVVDTANVTKWNDAVTRYNQAATSLKNMGVANDKLPGLLTGLSTSTVAQAKSALSTSQNASHADKSGSGKMKGKVNGGCAATSETEFNKIKNAANAYNNAVKAYNNELQNVKNQGAKIDLPNKAETVSWSGSYTKLTDENGKEVHLVTKGKSDTAKAKKQADDINGPLKGGVHYQNFVDNAKTTKTTGTGCINQNTANELNSKVKAYHTAVKNLKDALSTEDFNKLPASTRSIINDVINNLGNKTFNTNTTVKDAKAVVDGAKAILADKTLIEIVGKDGQAELQALADAIEDYNNAVNAYNGEVDALGETAFPESKIPGKAESVTDSASTVKQAVITDRQVKADVIKQKAGTGSQLENDINDFELESFQTVQQQYAQIIAAENLLPEDVSKLPREVTTQEELDEVLALIDELQTKAAAKKAESFEAYSDAITNPNTGYQTKRATYIDVTGNQVENQTPHENSKEALSVATARRKSVKTQVFGKEDGSTANYTDDSIYGRYAAIHGTDDLDSAIDNI